MKEIKVHFDLGKNQPEETMWVSINAEDQLILKNIPMFAFDLAFKDSIEIELRDEVPYFKQVKLRSGYSTFRLLLKTEFLEQSEGKIKVMLGLGCIVERPKGDSKLLTIAAPKDATNEVVKILEDMRMKNYIDYEIGYLFKE